MERKTSAWLDLEQTTRNPIIENNIDISQFETGDILLFHPTSQYRSLKQICSTIFESLIMGVTHSIYSHAAIIVKNPQFTNPFLEGLYVLESGYEGFPDAEDNEIKLGVELVKFEDVLRTFKGNIYHRKLTCERTEDFYDKLSAAHSVVHNRPYDLIPSDWFKAALRINMGATQRKKTFWCSALVAYIYTQLGFLPKDTPWTLVSPKMLGTENTMEELKFENCSLSPENKII